MAGKHISLEEYKKQWEKDPEAGKKKNESLQSQAKNLGKLSKQLKKRGNADLAKKLDSYGDAVKRVACPPENFKSKKDQEKWEKDQDHLDGLGQFILDNQADLSFAAKMAEEEELDGAEDEMGNSGPQQIQTEPDPEYQGFQDLLRMLIDALCEVFGHNYPELDAEKKREKKKEKAQQHHEQEVYKEEFEKAKERKKAEAGNETEADKEAEAQKSLRIEVRSQSKLIAKRARAEQSFCCHNLFLQIAKFKTEATLFVLDKYTAADQKRVQ